MEPENIELTTQKILALLQNKSYDTIENILGRVMTWIKAEPIQITLLPNQPESSQN